MTTADSLHPSTAGLVLDIANGGGGMDVHLAVRGTLDQANASGLADHLARIIQVRQPSNLHLDVADLAISDAAAALEVLAEARDALGALGGRLVLLGAPPETERAIGEWEGSPST